MFTVWLAFGDVRSITIVSARVVDALAVLLNAKIILRDARTSKLNAFPISSILRLTFETRKSAFSAGPQSVAKLTLFETGTVLNLELPISVVFRELSADSWARLCIADTLASTLLLKRYARHPA
jgi:hypothetical protein